jgi:hypothetical protein
MFLKYIEYRTVVEYMLTKKKTETEKASYYVTVLFRFLKGSPGIEPTSLQKEAECEFFSTASLSTSAL